ncbi:hypothetical protein [Rhodospirillaceae bacterium SYSU D60014]|uniref:hypothetical protein n=1 Tax=Virgifigura deserti TaxID=2268457 RepID=UPI000E660A99
MDFIFMLTRHDRTVEDCIELMDLIEPLKLRHIGFKDIGVDVDTLRQLNRRIKASGAASYMEVVSESSEACLRSARTAAEIGVDRLLGGTDAGPVLDVMAGSGTEYYPFPGLPTGHPTRLGGTPAVVAEHCRRFLAVGCRGVDLLAFRATEADPLDLIRAARAALGDAPLIVAGSVNSTARIREIAVAGADAFTIGTAVFDGSFSPRKGCIQSQLKDVLDACA